MVTLSIKIPSIEDRRKAKKARQSLKRSLFPRLPVREAMIPPQIVTLLSAITDADLSRVAKVYRDAMKAKTRRWIDDGATVGGKVQGHFVIEPDHKVRIMAANMVAAYREGLPVARSIALGGKFEELGDMISKLQASGEARRLLPLLQSIPNEQSSQG